MTVDISIHDNQLLRYSVDCRERCITLHTIYADREPHEYTDVVFQGVAAYHFEGDNFGTILFDITEVALARLYAAYRELFEYRKNYGWLALDYNTEEELLATLQEQGIRGFLISASYGMGGFVLCEEMRLVALPS